MAHEVISFMALPIDIRLMIMEAMPDTLCLTQIILTCSEMHSIYKKFKSNIILSVLDNELGDSTVSASILASMHMAYQNGVDVFTSGSDIINKICTSTTSDQEGLHGQPFEKNVWRYGLFNLGNGPRLYDKCVIKADIAQQAIKLHNTVKKLAKKFFTDEDLSNVKLRNIIYESFYNVWIISLIYRQKPGEFGKPRSERIPTQQDMNRLFDTFSSHQYNLIKDCLFRFQCALFPYAELSDQLQPCPYNSISVNKSWSPELQNAVLCGNDMHNILLLLASPPRLEMMEFVHFPIRARVSWQILSRNALSERFNWFEIRNRKENNV